MSTRRAIRCVIGFRQLLIVRIVSVGLRINYTPGQSSVIGISHLLDGFFVGGSLLRKCCQNVWFGQVRWRLPRCLV